MSSSQNPEQGNPDPAEQALANAIAHHQAGRLMEAERLYRLVLEMLPQQISALYRLGVLCLQDRRYTQALPYLEAALKLQPQNPHILNTLGVVLQNTGRGQDAVSYFQQALSINPSDNATLGNLARALRKQGKLDAAIGQFTKIIQTGQAGPDIYVETGRCYYEKGNFQEAAFYCEKALEQKPDYIEGLSALSAVLWAMGCRREALPKLERAVQIAPGNINTILNLGEFLYDEGRVDEALGYFNQALALAPQHGVALWRKSFALLAQGTYREGWALYAACLGQAETRGPNRFPSVKLWDGGPGPNRHLLIWCEQGLGDSLQFIRYAALCKSRVGKVSVFCQKPLVRLLRELPFLDSVSDLCDADIFDEQVPVMNLPHLFNTTLETIPATVPYLHVSATIKAKWAARFAKTVHALKVGLVWAGGSHQGHLISKITDAQRSISLERMKPWLDIQGIEFYSLQKDKPAEQIAALGLKDRLVDFMEEVSDFADTAAIVQNLDLVITIDTSVAHLAGALGKPVWIMSRYNADWRWLQNRPSSPWYPTARIFGQPAMGDWDSVITEIERELALEVEKHRASPG